MKKFGAEILVYEDSGFLAEAVLRIYPLVHKILFMVGIEPWNGHGDRRIPSNTLCKIMEMDDPDHKFVVVSKHWETEHQERNEGLRILRDHGCDWCFILDDDEMYNRSELWEMFQKMSEAQWANGRASAFMVRHLIYWRNRETVIEGLVGPFPTFISTQVDDVFFTTGRNFYLLGGVFNDINENNLVCHHLSYVRPEHQMRHKMSFFTHSHEIKNDWVDQVWLGWKPEMENLHPTNPPSFPRAVPASTVQWQLENMPGRLRKK